MSKNIKDIIAFIQYKLSLTQEEIADRIGYSRTRLNDAIRRNATGKILQQLKLEFAETLKESVDYDGHNKKEDIKSSEMSEIVAGLLDILEKKGISIASFSKQSGVNAERVHSWKAGRGNPKTEDSVLIQKWIDNHVINEGKDLQQDKEQHIIESATTGKETELQALLTITQVYAESHLGLVRSHEILNQNHQIALVQNDELIKMVEKDRGQKINLNSASNDLPTNETFVRLLSEFLANKYSLNQNEMLSDIGNIVLSFRASSQSSGIRKNA